MKRIFGLLAALCLVTLSACFSPWSGGGEGTITIAFGSADQAGRTIITPEEATGFTHYVTLTSPGRITERRSFPGTGLLTVAVPPGVWTIDIRAEGPRPGGYHATFPAQTLRAVGSGQAEVQAGRDAPAVINMTSAAEVSTHAQLYSAIGQATDGREKIIFIAPPRQEQGINRIIRAEATYVIPAGANITLASALDEPVAIGRIRYHDGIIFDVTGEGTTLTLGKPGMTGNIIVNGVRELLTTLAVPGSIIRVSNRAHLVMNDGVTLTGNLGASDVLGGAVHVGVNGSFSMRGGVISNNQAGHGGGVYVDSEAVKFLKTSGVIYGYGSDESPELANTATGRGNAVALPVGTATPYTFDETVRGTTANPLAWPSDDLPPTDTGDGNFAISVGQLRTWPEDEDITLPGTVSILAPGSLTITGSFSVIRWFLGENEIAEDSLDNGGATLILDSRIHNNEMRRHRVTVVVEAEGRAYSRVIAFAVGL